jgi:hypothetical protein
VSVRYVTVSDPAFISSSETVVDGEMSSWKKKTTFLNDLDAKKALMEPISQKLQELQLNNLV